MLLVAVDAHSKWLEVYPMITTTSVKTIEVLNEMFAAYGLPEQIISDNGPQFISEEFAIFMKSNGSAVPRIIQLRMGWLRGLCNH